MKTKMRLTALLLVIALLFTVGASGCKENGSGGIALDEQITLQPMTASADPNIFMYNPDRGFRTDLVVYVEDLVQYVGNEQQLMKQLSSVFSIYFGQLDEPCSMAFAYIYITPWHDKDLSDEAIEVIKALFELCRIRKNKLMVNFAYNQDYAINQTLSQENKDLLATQCADEETILRHIDQLAPVVAEYKDCIFDFTTGFIGYVGEWAFNYQYPEVDYDKITMAIVEKFCVPNDLYFSTRMPDYKLSVERNHPEWPYLDYISYNNCAMYGEQIKSGWESACYQLNHTPSGSGAVCKRLAHEDNDWWEYVMKNGAYTPNGGEMFTASSMNESNAIVSGQEMILEVAHHWHSYMSFWHCKYDTSLGLINIMETWERQEINKEWLDANNILYDPNWFADDNGNTVSRNCYEFIRDHLGYKIVASNVGIKAGDGKMTVSMDFKNYGMAAAFNLASGFAILNERYEVVSEVSAGTPWTWYSHDPENYQSNVALDHSISGELTTPTEAGTYYVAFYLKNTQGVGAQLSNKVLFENDFNILYSFNV